MTDTLVRWGEDVQLHHVRDPENPARMVDPHTALNVYGEMLWQVCRDYPGIGDFRRLTLDEIRFFYDGLRPELRRATAPKK